MKGRGAPPAGTLAPILGNSTSATVLRRQIARAAPYATNVLVTGPSGTGKELVARWLHEEGARADRPFVPVDCASLSGELMASQLFGHVAGAFTGASCDALGCFRAADRGTLFLDEIGELELPLQAKLLRVLQERVVTPVGSYRGYAVNVRVVAATNRDLLREVRAGRFREDLYYRLRVVHLTTTPLRQRLEDIPTLAEAFLGRLASEGLPRCTLDARGLNVLSRYDWPGNVRQLRNVLEQAVIDAEDSTIDASRLAELLAADGEGDQVGGRGDDSLRGGRWEAEANPLPPPDPSLPFPTAAGAWPTLAEVERLHVINTLKRTFDNRSAAARLLGVTRQSLLRKLARHDIVRTPRDASGD